MGLFAARLIRCPREAPNGAALNTFVAALCRCMPLQRQTGEMLGKKTARHPSAEFVPFLTDIVIESRLLQSTSLYRTTSLQS
jgi:hypothetical protein